MSEALDHSQNGAPTSYRESPLSDTTTFDGMLLPGERVELSRETYWTDYEAHGGLLLLAMFLPLCVAIPVRHFLHWDWFPCAALPMTLLLPLVVFKKVRKLRNAAAVTTTGALLKICAQSGLETRIDTRLISRLWTSRWRMWFTAGHEAAPLSLQEDPWPFYHAIDRHRPRTKFDYDATVHRVPRGHPLLQQALRAEEALVFEDEGFALTDQRLFHWKRENEPLHELDGRAIEEVRRGERDVLVQTTGRSGPDRVNVILRTGATERLADYLNRLREAGQRVAQSHHD